MTEDAIQDETVISASTLNVFTEEETTQDETISSPASMVYYDNFLDEDNTNAVVCARGVCVLPDEGDFDWSKPPLSASSSSSTIIAVVEDERSIVDKVVNSYLGPRLLLLFASILYGTNFPLG